jgi:DNA repair protein RadD
MQLRPYQQAMVDRVLEHWAAGRQRVLAVMPTGAGKTETAIAVVKAVSSPASRAPVMVDRKVLCKQWCDRLQRHGVGRVGILQGENTTAVSAPVLVATAQTIRARGVPEGVGLIVIDESHIWHATHDKVLDELGDAKVLGLTATPLRDGLGLRFDTLLSTVTIAELIARGHLVPPRYLAPKAGVIAEALESLAVRAGDFESSALSKAMRSKAIIGDVVGTWLKHGENRPTIAFCVDKQHARDMTADFVTASVPAELIVDDTDDDERYAIFQRFEQGDTRVLCSVGVLGVGFDSPIASCAILARPTLSLGLYVQQGGRVLRPSAGKTDALVLDHAGNTLRHGLLEQFEPPTDLSAIADAADKKSRKDKPLAWVCRSCATVNALADDLCVGCGEPRRRVTSLVVIDGQLQAVEHGAHETPEHPTIDTIRTGYRMLMHHAESKGLKPGWAYFATCRRYRVPESRAKSLIPFAWRDLPRLPPDEEMSRWLRADLQRQRIVQRHREARA